MKEESQSIPQKFVYISVFSLHPVEAFGHLGPPRSGRSWGMGRNDWHLEIVCEGIVKHPSQGPFVIVSHPRQVFAVVYLMGSSVKATTYPELETKRRQAVEIIDAYLLPDTYEIEQYLYAEFIALYCYTVDGKKIGGIGPLAHLMPSHLEMANTPPFAPFILLESSPKVKRALMYFNNGLFFASSGHYADACVNYLRAIESLLGQWNEALYKKQSGRLALGFKKLKKIMSEKRNLYAIVHVGGGGPNRPLRNPPDEEEEREFRIACKEVIDKFWEPRKQLKCPDAHTIPFLAKTPQAKFRKQYMRWQFKPQNLPSPREAVKQTIIREQK